MRRAITTSCHGIAEELARLETEGNRCMEALIRFLVGERETTPTQGTAEKRADKPKILHLEDGCLTHEYTPDRGAADTVSGPADRLHPVKEQVA
jgi:hypothetical protein